MHHYNEDIIGKTSGAEHARSTKAVKAARERGYTDMGEVAEEEEAEEERRRKKAEEKRNKRTAAAAAAAAAADAASDVVTALAAFEGVTRLAMARKLVALDTGGRAALLHKFLVAKGAA